MPVKVEFMRPAIEKYLEMLESIGVYFFLSLLLGIAVTLLIDSWRKNLSYLVAAVTFGTILGYGVFMTESWSSFAVLATLFGTIAGPATISKLQKKSVLDLAGDLREIADLATKKENTYGRYPTSGSPSLPRRSGDARSLPQQGDPYD